MPTGELVFYDRVLDYMRAHPDVELKTAKIARALRLPNDKVSSAIHYLRYVKGMEVQLPVVRLGVYKYKPTLRERSRAAQTEAQRVRRPSFQILETIREGLLRITINGENYAAVKLP
jgi:hypothetical protein